MVDIVLKRYPGYTLHTLLRDIERYPYWWGQVIALFEVELEAREAKEKGKLKVVKGKELTETEINANESAAAFRSHDNKIARAKAILRKAGA